MKLLLLCLMAGVMGAKAQMGYQISLLNTATGEPRANETVTVSVSLSNNANEVFYTETKSATTNDFGVLSLSIGNADTFKNVDFSKMPFFIEVTANGVSIGKSQILSVPVAEVAKQLAPKDKNLIVGTWCPEDIVLNPQNASKDGYETYTFVDDNTCRIDCYEYSYENGSFYIKTNAVVNYIVEGTNVFVLVYSSLGYFRDGFTLFKYFEGSLLTQYQKYLRL